MCEGIVAFTYSVIALDTVCMLLSGSYHEFMKKAPGFACSSFISAVQKVERHKAAAACHRMMLSSSCLLRV